MRVLTIKQPWASLIILGAKKWETRSWAPSRKMQMLLQQEGFLIHSSGTFDKRDQKLVNQQPFSHYIRHFSELPLGKLIGFARLSRIITTDEWEADMRPGYMPDAEEHAFGNYDPNRYAWGLKDVVSFTAAQQVTVKGMLGLWQYHSPLPFAIPTL